MMKLRTRLFRLKLQEESSEVKGYMVLLRLSEGKTVVDLQRLYFSTESVPTELLEQLEHSKIATRYVKGSSITDGWGTETELLLTKGELELYNSSVNISGFRVLIINLLQFFLYFLYLL